MEADVEDDPVGLERAGDLDGLEQLIVARTVETRELWENLAETYPRTTAPSRPEPIGPMPLQVIPPTGPTRPRSPRRRSTSATSAPA